MSLVVKGCETLLWCLAYWEGIIVVSKAGWIRADLLDFIKNRNIFFFFEKKNGGRE